MTGVFVEGNKTMPPDRDTPTDPHHQAKRPGRPLGSGEQLPPAARKRKSRDQLAAAGAVRLDFFLDADSAAQLAHLMERWDSPSRKDAIQRALGIVHQSIYGK